MWLARQVNVCTRFGATTVPVHTLEKQTGVMERQETHGKKVESISNETLTLADWKDLATDTNKSAITDHAAIENHVIDWTGAKIIDRESHRKTRQLKVSTRNCMNRDGKPTTCQRLMTVLWSRGQRHVTIFVGE